MRHFFKNNLFIFFIIFSSIFLFMGFTPIKTLQSINKQNDNYSSYKNSINNNEFKECLTNIEINKIIDSLYYTIEEDNLSNVINNYKDIIIKESTKYTHDGEYTIANNLLNSRLRYYQNDSKILNLINYNNQQKLQNDYEEYTGIIEHLSFNTLIAFPEKALDIKNNLNSKYDEEKITAYEFKQILNELYNNNYILISMSDIFEINNNSITRKPSSITINSLSYCILS